MSTRNLLFSLPLFFLFTGVVFFSLPDTSHSGILVPGPECCQFEANGCFDIIPDNGRLCLVEDTVTGVCNESTGVCEQAEAEATPIPAYNKWGLLIIAAALGIAGIIVYRRRRASA